MGCRFKYASMVTLVVLIAFSALYLVKEIDRLYHHQVTEYRHAMVDEAIAHYKIMVSARQWNASHGGVYVQQREGLEPNPYLVENVLRSENNETLIKINPAWMTRQVSELSNQEGERYYKITSLLPLNPDNAPDGFEAEALKFFETSPQESYYYQFEAEDETKPMFNFMGKLVTKKACLQCHEKQGYKVGDVRGGIRVSIPMQNHLQAVENARQKRDISTVFVLGVSTLFSLLMLTLLHLLFKRHERLQEFSRLLEEQVRKRTSELTELNNELDKRVRDEVLKNKEKDQLIIAQSRHAAMGEMISMIAHQWRQPISIISMDANNMLVDIELDAIDNEELRTTAEGIIKQTEHLSMTIDDFRNFFRPSKTAENIEVIDVVDECFKIVGDSLKTHHITFESSSASDRKIETFSRELLQVIISIINNAKDAFIERGIKEPRITVRVSDYENGVLMTVEDNAGGISDEIAERIFEPYFTTKSNKNGTGLGLYMSKMIVENHLHGTIGFESKSGSTTFSIWLSQSL